ncbi:MAG: hypothetical protein JXR76_29220 [Deltaproteobacteria bacterium]|nr:hypothetical protein [Deltaproteobacteria bacterium]
MKWIVYIATATIFLLLLIPSLNQSLVRRQYGIDWIVASGKLGNALRLQYPENTLIAAPHIGALGYYSKLPMLDMLGLTDKHIANSTPNPEVYREYPQKDVGHERFDIEYALSRKPRIFVPINGFTSVPATHISEVPVRFAMEHVLINRMNSHPEYQLTNIPVENNFYWIVLEKKHIRNPL